MRSRVQLLSVTDGVWCFRQRSYVCCSYAVVDDDGVVLVDSGMTTDAEPVLNGLAQLDRSPADVHTILLTHWHNDHAAGAARIKELSGATVYYHHNERPYFTRETARGGFPGWLSSRIPERGPLVLFRGLLSAATSTAVPADVLLDDRDLVLGRFRVIVTPGHTPGHVAYFHEPSRVLFAGDALAVVRGKLRFMARPVTSTSRTRARRWPICSNFRCATCAPDTDGRSPRASRSRSARYTNASAQQDGRCWVRNRGDQYRGTQTPKNQSPAICLLGNTRVTRSFRQRRHVARGSPARPRRRRRCDHRQPCGRPRGHR